jgi:hypothetical protein
MYTAFPGSTVSPTGFFLTEKTGRKEVKGMTRILPAGTAEDGKDGGFVLLRSLISMAAVLLCTAALCAALAAALKGEAHLESRMRDEIEYRNLRVMERMR